MVTEGVGRLPVLARAEPHKLVGIVSRSDLLAAHAPRLDAASRLQTPRRPRLVSTIQDADDELT